MYLLLSWSSDNVPLLEVIPQNDYAAALVLLATAQSAGKSIQIWYAQDNVLRLVYPTIDTTNVSAPELLAKVRV